MAKRVKPGNPNVAIAYLRASTARQVNGPDAQRDAIEAWAARNGVRIAAWHFDRISGTTDAEERPELIAALMALREHGAGLLVVHERSRLARSMSTAVFMEREVARAGARIVSADGVDNGDDPDAVFMRQIRDAFAQREVALIRARIKSALAAKKRRGERVGTVPYGYRADAAGKLVPEPEEQRVVERVRALRAGDMPLRTIVVELERAGLRSRTGKPFQLTQVARMLRAEGQAA